MGTIREFSGSRFHLQILPSMARGELPYIKGRDARQEISNEPLKCTNLGMA